MKTKTDRIANRALAKFTLNILSVVSSMDLIIPYYHIVSDDEVLHVKHLFKYKNIRQFEDDLDFLLNSFSPVGLTDFLDDLELGRSLPRKALLLTFDDGHREIYDVIAPLLMRKGIPATFFLTSEFIDNKKLFYKHKASLLVDHLEKKAPQRIQEKVQHVLSKREMRFQDIKTDIMNIRYEGRELINELAMILEIDFLDYLSRYEPYVTTDQVQGLIKCGFTIGAHSINHPIYSSIPLEEQLYQTIASIKFIKKRFNVNYGAFAFPHSDKDVSKRFFIELYKSGIIDISFGTGGMVNDNFPRNFQRFSLEKPLLDAERLIYKQCVKRMLKMILGSKKIYRT